MNVEHCDKQIKRLNEGGDGNEMGDKIGETSKGDSKSANESVANNHDYVSDDEELIAIRQKILGMKSKSENVNKT